jgi:hypothetical protein
MASTRTQARLALATTHTAVGPTPTLARARPHRRRALVVVGLAVVAACSQPAAVRAGLTSTTPDQTALKTLLFGPSTPGLQTLPAAGNAALVQAIGAVATDLGVPTDATAQVAAAQLPNDVTSRLAVVLADMHSCDVVTAAALTQLQPAVATPLGDSMPSIPATSVSALRGCAATMYTDGLALKDYVKTQTAAGSAPGPGNVLDVWPVVHLDYTGAGHEYDWDYALTVATGNNIFYNNAGSNVLDPFNGPLNGQPSRGCELVSEILGAAVPKCVLASAMLIQVGGSSTFGQFQTPNADAFMPGTSPPVPCTTGNLVRRLFTEGSSVAGVGILINDGQGKNTYLGKAGTQGTGHIGGVGILHIEGGTNLLDAIRNGQGFGFVGGLGILHSKNARNTFITYMPLANAPGDASTTGTGIVDDAGKCEGRPRHLQGSGELGGTGVLYAVQSNGEYNSNTDLAQGTGDVFPPGTPQPNLGGPGSGILVSRGSDKATYYGVPGRAEGTAVVGVRATLDPSVTATDIFDDDVFPFVASDPCAHGCAPDARVLAPLLLSMT